MASVQFTNGVVQRSMFNIYPHDHPEYVPHRTPSKPRPNAPVMASLQIEPDMPAITPEMSLTGWRREFCIELRGEGAARIYVRAVERSSQKAAELARATLFHRLEPRFADLAGCVEALRPDLERLADSARRVSPSAENLFAAVTYDKPAWERVQAGLERWARRPAAPASRTRSGG